VALDPDTADELRRRIERLVRRREQLGPVNPLAKAEYDEALAYVEELERQRTDLETALRELRGLIRETDRQIRETFEETFEAPPRTSRSCPRGSSRRPRAAALVREDAGPRPVLGGADLPDDGTGAGEVAGRAGRGGRRRPRGRAGRVRAAPSPRTTWAWRSRSRPRASR
jgi:chromosome segregation protein